MFFIPGWLIALLTFPGIIVHELGHLIMCRIAGVRVQAYSLIRWGNPMGYVIHEKPKSLFKSFLITFGPFFINTLGTMLAIIAGGMLSYLNPLLAWLFLWLAASIGMHAFPSFQDAKSLLSHVMETVNKGQILNIAYLPFVGLIYLGGALSFFWADLIYAGAIIGFTLGTFGIPLFYNINNAPDIRVVSDNALLVGCDLSIDGQPLGETTETATSRTIPKSIIESTNEHTLKCEFVGCRQWNMNKNQIMSSGSMITLDWDNAEFVDCNTNESLDESQIETYKSLEEAFTEKTRVRK